LIKTKDEREFLTHEKNFVQLIEFSKTFGVEISVVKLREPAEIFDLEQLVPAFCTTPNKKHKVKKYNYEVLEVKIPVVKYIKKNKISNREYILETAKQIRAYIIKEFLSEKVVTLHGIAKRFNKYGLSLSAICNHIRRVKKELDKEGCEIKKIGPGKYKLMN
jgi:hypothetical protein